jgi:hypothetical protein
MQAVSPGPGQYSLPDAMLHQGPAFTFGARSEGQQRASSSKARDMPGPGAYAARWALHAAATLGRLTKHTTLRKSAAHQLLACDTLCATRAQQHSGACALFVAMTSNLSCSLL